MTAETLSAAETFLQASDFSIDVRPRDRARHSSGALVSYFYDDAGIYSSIDSNALYFMDISAEKLQRRIQAISTLISFHILKESALEPEELTLYKRLAAIALTDTLSEHSEARNFAKASAQALVLFRELKEDLET